MRAILTRLSSGDVDHTSTRTYLSMAALVKHGIVPAVARLGGGQCLVDVLDDNGKRIEQYVMDKWGKV